jgi:hypothetical protein
MDWDRRHILPSELSKFVQRQSVFFDISVEAFDRGAVLDFPQTRLFVGDSLGDAGLGNARDVDGELLRLRNKRRVERKVCWPTAGGPSEISLLSESCPFVCA